MHFFISSNMFSDLLVSSFLQPGRCWSDGAATSVLHANHLTFHEFTSFCSALRDNVFHLVFCTVHRGLHCQQHSYICLGGKFLNPPNSPFVPYCIDFIKFSLSVQLHECLLSLRCPFNSLFSAMCILQIFAQTHILFLLLLLTFAIFTKKNYCSDRFFTVPLSIYQSMIWSSLYRKGLPECQWFLETCSATQLLEANIKGPRLRYQQKGNFSLYALLFSALKSLYYSTPLLN